MNDGAHREGARTSNVVMGLCFIVGGVLLLLYQLDVLSGSFWPDAWPWIVVGMGVILGATARTAERVGTGVMFVGFGLWFLATIHGWMGLDWERSWPLALVAIGAGTVARAIAGSFLPDRAPRRRREEAVHEG